MRSVGEFAIRPATAADLPAVREMLREYVHWIGLDLAFQEIDEELAALPGEYAPPRGALFVVPGDEGLIATIGLRPLGGTMAEMKRLFVRPAARGHGLAKQLILRVLDEARRLGYTEIRLDTLPMMGDAQALYAAMGFADIEPYYDTPIAGTRFMAKPL
ncbi:MAG: GNAT family N-acetyltransferase [Vicinamibacterales bacterium]